MSLPAIECVRRGVANARANWELVLAQWVGLTLSAILTVASVLPLLFLIGFAGFTALRSPQDISQWVSDWGGRFVTELFAFSVPMALALIAVVAIGTLGMIVWCFFQAGMYGVLVAGDRQSPAGPPGDWRLFRTFTAENFRGWGASHVWRFFWFFNLVLMLFTVLFAGFILLAGLVALAGQAWGGVAAVGVGCGGVLPLFFLMLLMGLWVGVAQADLANSDSSLRVASRRARRVLGKRLGGLLLIMLLGMVASVVVSMVFVPLSLGIDLAFRDAMFGGLVLKGVMYLVQWGVSGALQVALAASLVALVRDEAREEVR
ncbi:MAG: hypothetical protein ABI609_08900 [Acidobacteriota bacterium]